MFFICNFYCQILSYNVLCKFDGAASGTSENQHAML